MDIVVDIGNTRIKYGVFEQGQLVDQGHVPGADQLVERLQPLSIQHLVGASVAQPAAEVLARLPHTGTLLELSPSTPLPVQNLYQTPQTLGADRMAGVIGAAYLFPGQDCLVIDAGTCITYDLVDKANRYHGGSISPGIDMKFKALHTFTGRLPLTERTEESIFIGQNTRESIQSGVLVGTVAEVQGFISLYRQHYSSLTTVLCGGDAAFFDTKLKAPIFVIPELVLIGLYRILQHNV
ncbi:type III pantothenate kinase [soil metagenome]